MLIRLGISYAAHLAGGMAAGALAVVAVHLARKSYSRRAEQKQPATES